MNEYDDYPDTDWSDEWDDNVKSKTQVKKELLALKELGRSLIELSMRDLNKLQLDDNLREAIINAHGMSKGALKRQVGFVGGLIAKADHEKIQQDLDKLRQPHQGEVKRFHQLEEWRDRLIAGDNAVFGELMAEFAEFDMQHVRQLVRNAQKEAKQEKPPKSARALFQYLQHCQSQAEE